MPLEMAMGCRPAAGLEARHRGMPYNCEAPLPPRMHLAYSRARAGLSGELGVTDLLSAGAHRRLLLSRPPPRRTVRTLLEKQNWGVRHRGFAASPIPVLRWWKALSRTKVLLAGMGEGGELLWGLPGLQGLLRRSPTHPIRLLTSNVYPLSRVRRPSRGEEQSWGPKS